MAKLADEFVEALKRLERKGEVEAVLALFHEDAIVSNPILSGEGKGGDEPARFWRDYHASFDEITSEFRAVAEEAGTAFLEWESRGQIDGKPFRYGGVSVLEEKDGKITAFRTYFDPSQLPAVDRTTDDRSELDRAQEELAEQRAEGGYS
ncbi:nuclear transport factor 2 family protein [Affinirhizobium pseudoryzae]|uniref:nuclear transport factor 2 family protein n=1 Tax=Allorhizobium pseudoryzae TaxID=379684 RepID=UPI0013EE060E|nr:nuclear transport factor 2 family protein [Allorhizobium pseudoryzae]